PKAFLRNHQVVRLFDQLAIVRPLGGHSHDGLWRSNNSLAAHKSPISFSGPTHEPANRWKHFVGELVVRVFRLTDLSKAQLGYQLVRGFLNSDVISFFKIEVPGRAD